MLVPVFTVQRLLCVITTLARVSLAADIAARFFLWISLSDSESDDTDGDGDGVANERSWSRVRKRPAASAGTGARVQTTSEPTRRTKSACWPGSNVEHTIVYVPASILAASASAHSRR